MYDTSTPCTGTRSLRRSRLKLKINYIIIQPAGAAAAAPRIVYIPRTQQYAE